MTIRLVESGHGPDPSSRRHRAGQRRAIAASGGGCATVGRGGQRRLNMLLGIELTAFSFGCTMSAGGEATHGHRQPDLHIL